MRDPEFIELRKRFLLGILIIVVFAVPIIIFLVRTYGDSKVLSKLNKKESFTILVTSNECEKCDLVNDILKENNVRFVELNSFTNKDYEEIMRRLKVINKRDEFPILIYVEDGIMKANLFLINDESSVTNFLDFHKLNNSKLN